MSDDRDVRQSEWERWQSRSRRSTSTTPARAPAVSIFLGVVIADAFIVGIAFVAGLAIGFQSWGDEQPVSQSLAGKQEGQILTAAAIACSLLALVALLAWKQRVIAAVVLQVVVIIVVLVVAVSWARIYHHQTHPMSWLGFVPQLRPSTS